MIVVCTSVQLTEEQKRALGYSEASSISYSLTVERQYVVLGLSFLTSSLLNQGVNCMVEDDIGRCAFVPACLFDVASSAVSEHWVVQRTERLDWVLWPKEFLEEFFHDDLSDGDPRTLSIFRVVCDRMKIEARRHAL